MSGISIITQSNENTTQITTTTLANWTPSTQMILALSKEAIYGPTTNNDIRFVTYIKIQSLNCCWKIMVSWVSKGKNNGINNKNKHQKNYKSTHNNANDNPIDDDNSNRYSNINTNRKSNYAINWWYYKNNNYNNINETINKMTRMRTRTKENW